MTRRRCPYMADGRRCVLAPGHARVQHRFDLDEVPLPYPERYDLRPVDPSEPTNLTCVHGPFRGEVHAVSSHVDRWAVYQAPFEDVDLFWVEADWEPPVGCKLLGYYVRGTGAQRGTMTWRDA